MWVYDRETLAFLAVNEAAIEKYGYSREEFLGGMTIKDIRPKERLPDLLSHYEAMVKSEDPGTGLRFEGLTQHKRKDGSLLDVEFVWASIPFGGRRAILSFTHDVTEQRASEAALGSYEDKFEKVFRASPVGICITTPDDNLILDVNERMTQMLGWSREELLGRSCKGIFECGAGPDHDEFMERLRRDGRANNLEVHFRTRSGERREALTSVEMIEHDGRPAVLSISQDITERIRVEEELRASNERFILMTRATNDVVWDWDVVTNGLWWNDAVSTALGYEPKNVGHHLSWWYDRIHPDDRQRVVTSLHDAAESAVRFWSEEYRFLHADGTYLHFHDRGYVLREEAGKAVRMIGAMTDVSEAKRSEALMAGQNQVLEMTATGRGLTEILEALTRLIEGVCPGTICSVLLMDPDGRRLRHGAAPGLPDAYNQAVDGVVIGMGQGSCGTAAYLGRRVIVHDILTDPLWAKYTEVAKAFNLRASWSTPILSGMGKVLGTFAMYYSEPRSPSPRDLQFAEIAAHIGRIAIERKETEEERARLLGAEQRARAQSETALEEVQEGRERLRMLSRRLVALQEAERREISRELHDEIGQVLTGLKLMLEASDNGRAGAETDSQGHEGSGGAGCMAAAGAPARASADRPGSREEIKRLVNELMQRVRELSMNLRPPMLDDLGLIPALLWHFDRYTLQTQVRVDFHHSGVKRFPSETETAAFRVVQEALTNVARHSGAEEVKVELKADRDALAITIEDQGRGFDSDAALSGASSGLSGMRERVRLLGGRFRINATEGMGTKLSAELPLAAAAGVRRE
jgi:PAS domain S-box-containing protein